MQELIIIFRLKLLVDIGLVGFPNAGKPTLVLTIFSARPKIASCPFATLEPSLGIVECRDRKSFVVANIPGIIEGASEGEGLGLRFLQHIEHNSLLLFMVPGDTDDIKREYGILLNELQTFNPDVMDRRRVLAVTKCDLLDDELIEVLHEALPANPPVVFIFAVTGKELNELKGILQQEPNSESNKFKGITTEDNLTHRSEDPDKFATELAGEGEFAEIEYTNDGELGGVADLEDFEYEDLND